MWSGILADVTNIQQADAALDHVESLGKIYKRARAETERIRPVLAEAIRRAHALGVRQVDIVRATGYTRDQVRKITNAGGRSADSDHGGQTTTVRA